MENKKKIIMVVLSILVCVMAVGYALLAQKLNITGTSSIDSTWKVEITNIQEGTIVGDATSKVTPSYTSTTANFSVGLIQPGDSITYDIEISNLGTLKAKVDSINVVMDESDAITYTTSGVQQKDKLGVGEKATLSVTVAYNSEVTSQPADTNKDLTVTINYVQDLGNDEVTYDTYSIGDVVTFAGSNWYVIKNSTAEEDYVTLMKEKVLTNEELEEYASTWSIICEQGMVVAGAYGCENDGETITKKYDAMYYYWSDTCHISGYYGYTESDDYSGCDVHNDYEGSKVKEYLEGTYINVLGSDNLKEVDGYKVRLITTDELEKNGWVGNTTICTGSCYEDYGIVKDSAPAWVYQNLGDWDKGVYGYFIINSNATGVSSVGATGSQTNNLSVLTSASVRPVINLLKSSI